MRRLIAVVTAVACSGCSLFMTSSPNQPPSPPRCRSSKVPPVIDLVIGLGGLIGAPIASAASDATTTSNQDKRQGYALAAGFLALTGLVALTSAVIGVGRVRRCEKAIRSWEMYQQPPRVVLEDGYVR